jgi:hypothetical protein
MCELQWPTAPSWLGSESWISSVTLRDEVQARRELPGEGVQILRAAGHDAVTVLDQGLGDGRTRRYSQSFESEPAFGKVWVNPEDDVYDSE